MSAVMCTGKVNSDFLVGFSIRVNVGVQLFLADAELRIRRSLCA